jgi:uncharacterized protein
LKLPDSNLLVYTLQPQSRHHDVAVNWIETAMNGRETIGFASVALIGFIRIATLPQLNIPGALGKAMDQLDEWLSQPAAKMVNPGPGHFAVMRQLLEQAGSAGNLTNDAHLAALALQHSGTVTSFDSDFYRFPTVSFEHLTPTRRS